MRRLQPTAPLAPPAVLLALAIACLGSPRTPAADEAPRSARYPRHVLILRHAEKTADADDVHLSPRGRERAQVLNQLFTAAKDRPEPFPTPDFIFAACHHADSQRPVETVTPLARRLMLSINDRYDSKLPAVAGADAPKQGKKPRMGELRDELFGSPRYVGKTILISWRHKTIPDLARTLKATDVPSKWDDRVFDRVWQITFDDRGSSTFRDRPQRLLAGDADK